MARELPNWIEAFIEYTEPGGAPERLRRWAAISCVAGALERRVWVYTLGAPLYPNLYIFLVSPPGIGKSRALGPVTKFWGGLEDHRVAATSVTKASLVDELSEAHRIVFPPGVSAMTEEFHSLKVSISELGVFLTDYANDFMNTLTDLYDCSRYAERRRTKNLNIVLEKPQLNLLAGTTPSYLNAVIPDGAWDQGFLSRTILVFSAEKKMRSMFDVPAANEVLGEKLKKDLEKIGTVYGKLLFTEEAASFIDAWYLGGQSPMPTHPRLLHYNTRRPAHLLKLCQVACMATGDRLEITLDHVRLALDWLVDAEIAMPDIFKSMASGGDAKVMDECWHFLFQYYAKFKEGARKELVLRFLSQKLPAHSVERVLNLMEEAGTIRAEAVKGKGMLYTARARGELG